MLRRFLLGLSWVHLTMAVVVVGFAGFAAFRFLHLAHWASATLAFRPFDHEANAVARVVETLEQPRSVLALVVPVLAYAASLVVTWRFFRALARVVAGSPVTARVLQRARRLPALALTGYMLFVLASLVVGGYWSRAASLQTLAELTQFMPPAQPSGMAAVPFYLLWLVYWVGRLLPSLWGPAALALALAGSFLVRWLAARQDARLARLPA